MVAALKDIVKGAHVRGIDGDDIVKILSVDPRGAGAIEVVYKRKDSPPGEIVLFRDDEDRLEIVTSSIPWSFDGDGSKMRLVSEAHRIHLAHVFDPYLAVHTSSVDPLPHQISAVYERMLPQLPLRFLLADDPGAGKTIMTGLFIKEMMVRGDFKRVLIVAPGSLVEQWQDELGSKFHLRFQILSNELAENAGSGNIFTEVDLMIARLDKLSRNDDLKAKLRTTEWDLIVVDEAHKMSASVFRGKTDYTKRYQLGMDLSDITRHFLLLTATPHNGKNPDFYLFLSLIDRDRFEGLSRTPEIEPEVGDIMRRLVKEDLLKFDGTRLFPERKASTVSYDLSPDERELYERVTAYVREQFNRADKLDDGKAKNTVGFALTILQRRLASSPEAIYQSICRRRKRLEDDLEAIRSGKVIPRTDQRYRPIFDDDLEEDELTSEELESENELFDDFLTSSRQEDMEIEIASLAKLEVLADKVRRSGNDQKWKQLVSILDDAPEMVDASGAKKKLIIFTEQRDTLRYLSEKLTDRLGAVDRVVTIHGAMSRDDRRRAEERFKQDPESIVLIATDAAGEGINLQRAHLMINYDIPWNPNRLEQRFGRIHRIDQTEVCHMWNLVAKGTREGDVFARLFSKLEEERRALGGKVFDVLGKISFDNEPLRKLLIKAIRDSDTPEVRARMFERVVDEAFDREELKKLLKEHALTGDAMDTSQIIKIHEAMERMEARKLQPRYVEAFFNEAFKDLGGNAKKLREEGRYEIRRVPNCMMDRPEQISAGTPVLRRYERVCFDKAHCLLPGAPQAELICPGHPLLDAAIAALRDRYRDTLSRGVVFIDNTGRSDEPRLLFYIDSSIVDGTRTSSGTPTVVSRRMLFVEIHADGRAVKAGNAPYLDYRAAADDEISAVTAWMKGQEWLSADIEKIAKDFATDSVIPDHLKEVKDERLPLLDKIADAVKTRLSEESTYWYKQASKLKHDEEDGKEQKSDLLNSKKAHDRAEEIVSRKERRLAEIAQEKNISPKPAEGFGGALVIPQSMIESMMGSQPDPAHEPGLFSHGDRRAVELAAMDAVMKIERELGYDPRDVSADNEGYDILSEIPQDKRTGDADYRFIEVKGRAKGADTVTVTANEIRVARNKMGSYILAIVEVDGDHTHTIYLADPFDADPSFTTDSENKNIKKLIASSKVVYQERAIDYT